MKVGENISPITTGALKMGAQSFIALGPSHVSPAQYFCKHAIKHGCISKAGDGQEQGVVLTQGCCCRHLENLSCAGHTGRVG